VPRQFWQDQLRASDDGSFTKKTITNTLMGSDPIDYVHSKAAPSKYNSSMNNYLNNFLSKRNPNNVQWNRQAV